MKNIIKNKKRFLYISCILYSVIIILEIISAIISLINGNIMYSLIMSSLALLFFILLFNELSYLQSTLTFRVFKVVDDKYRKTTGEVILPKRGSTNAMAYDFYANDDYTVEPGKVAKIWTDVKAYMEYDEGLIVNIRSSMGGKWMLNNTLGWIDSDYYGNPDTDGNIGIFLKNISNEVQTIKRGERIAQGMFVKYLITYNDDTDAERKGGFGSTGK